MQFKFFNLEFRPNWLGTLVVAICIPLFIKLGFWQYHKAILKQEIQARSTQQSARIPDLANYLSDPLQLKYYKVVVYGAFETRYQFLLDNQVENGQAGFHVVTPFRIAGTKKYVLVNRGWIAGFAEHGKLPEFETPGQQLEIIGIVWQPSDKIFTLERVPETSTEKNWSPVWQHLDMKKFQAESSLPVLPAIVKMDPTSPQGGFVRNWQVPAERIVTHLGYAYQWFGFALAASLIYLYLGFRKLEQ
jgi:surfeit locus 1 family protein